MPDGVKLSLPLVTVAVSCTCEPNAAGFAASTTFPPWSLTTVSVLEDACAILNGSQGPVDVA